MKALPWSVFFLLAVSSCQPEVKLNSLDAEKLQVAPMKAEFPGTFVGSSSFVELDVFNPGKVRVDASVEVQDPFSVENSGFSVDGADSFRLRVFFSPTSAGRISSFLKVNESVVDLSAEGLAPLVCEAVNACQNSNFDLNLGICVATPKENGLSCNSMCLREGSICSNGACIGLPKDCGDNNACTLDFCGQEMGCGHSPIKCPESDNPCKVSTCDSKTGCQTENVEDGTLCAPDTCMTDVLDVCMNGQCVKRNRPNGSSDCKNQWVPAYMPERDYHAMAYDSKRKKLVVFGGRSGETILADTWEMDSMTGVWTHRTPEFANQTPSARFGHAMAYDSARGKVVLFGGRDDDNGNKLDDTWEWDGNSWTQSNLTGNKPSARWGNAMAYDSARGKVVLFGGVDNNYLDDTWEWDGNSWTQRNLIGNKPSARVEHAMAYDSARGKVVLFGGYGNGLRNDTWEWDGNSWTQRNPTGNKPSARWGNAMAYDSTRGKVVLFGGIDGNLLDDTWEWDGNSWTQRTPTGNKPPARMKHATAYDSARGKVVLFGGGDNNYLDDTWDDTWEWDGNSWTQRNNTGNQPSARWDNAMAYDSTRGKVVLFGGRNDNHLDDTWEWDGNSWTQRNTTGNKPPARIRHAMAYDSARGKVVLFGGWNGNHLDDTWEWDGNSWTQRSTPGNKPSARNRHAMTYDSTRGKVVLFGGDIDYIQSLNDTWEWDGNSWAQLPLQFTPFSGKGAMVYDSANKRLVYFGAGTWTLQP